MDQTGAPFSGHLRNLTAYKAAGTRKHSSKTQSSCQLTGAQRASPLVYLQYSAGVSVGGVSWPTHTPGFKHTCCFHCSKISQGLELSVLNVYSLYYKFCEGLTGSYLFTSQTPQASTYDLLLKSVTSEDLQELAFALSVPQQQSLVGTARQPRLKRQHHPEHKEHSMMLCHLWDLAWLGES